jgi:tetratricopeptide (TPR) repeat protein
MDDNTLSTETDQNAQKRATLYQIIIICVLLAVVILTLYWRVRGFDFTAFDDRVYVADNLHVKGGLSLEGLKWAFHLTRAGDVSYWHPLTWLSHMLDYELLGPKAGMHHLSNVLYHVLNTILLFIALRLFTGSTSKSAFVAMLFAIHPINVESVAWISERKNLLSTFFWMLTLLLYYYYVKKPSLERYLIVFLAFILGLLSKPMLVTLPFVLLLLDFWPMNRIRLVGENITDISKSILNMNNAKLILEKVPLIILSFVMIVYSSRVMSNIGSYISIETVPMNLRIKNAIVSYILYIEKMFWPDNLTFFYRFPQEVPMWEVVGALTFILTITILGLKYIKKFPYIIFGWLWFIGTLIPVSGIIQAGAWPEIAERFAYIPLIGLFIIFSWGVPDLLKKLRKKEIFICIAASIIILSLSVKTWSQIGYWKDDFTLCKHALQVSKNNVAAHNNLGLAYYNKGEEDKAFRQFQEAIQVEPLNFLAYLNIAKIYFKRNELKLALENFEKSLELNPMIPITHLSYALYLTEVGRHEDALKQFNETLKLDPYSSDVQYYISLELEKMGKIDDAKSHLREALKINPKEARVHFELGKILIESGKNDEAQKEFNEVLKMKPEGITDYNALGIILLAKGKNDDAQKYFNKALKIDPKNTFALNALAECSAKKGNNDEAVKYLNESLKIESNNVYTHYKLGTILVTTGRIEEAVTQFNEALRINPDYNEAQVELGNLMQRIGNFDEAIQLYLEILKKDPHQAAVCNNLGSAYFSKGNIKKAIEYYQNALHDKPDYALAEKNLKVAQTNQKNLEDLSLKIQGAIKAYPNNPMLFTKLGETYRLLGDDDKATVQYRKALSIQPQYTQALYGLVLIYSHQQENYTKALDLLQDMRQYQPGNPSIYYNIACIYAKQNKVNESLSWIQKAIDKGFHDWDSIKKDPDLTNIRNTSYIIDLIKKHHG